MKHLYQRVQGTSSRHPAFLTSPTSLKKNASPSFFPKQKKLISDDLTSFPFSSTGQANIINWNNENYVDQMMSSYSSSKQMEGNLRLYARRGPTPPRGLNVGGTETSIFDLIGFYSQPILYFLLISAIMLSVEKFFSSRFGKGIVWKFFTSDELKAQKLEAEKRRKMKKLAALANAEAEKEDLSLAMPTAVATATASATRGGTGEVEQKPNSGTGIGQISEEEKAVLAEKLRKKKELEAEMEAALIQSFKTQNENEEENNQSSVSPSTMSNKLLRKSDSNSNRLTGKQMEDELSGNDDEDEEDEDEDEEEEEEDEEDMESGEEPTLRGYRCEECYYTIYPAAGREFKFFPADFTCPSCGAPRDSFFDPNDPNDPRNWEEEVSGDDGENEEGLNVDDDDDEYDFDIEDGDLDLDLGDDDGDGDDFRL